jgi:DUF1365 family protein
MSTSRLTRDSDAVVDSPRSEQGLACTLPGSCLYEGVVRHRRFSPVRHDFRYSLFMACLDLADLDRALRYPGLWSTAPFSLYRFRRSDYHGSPTENLEDSVRHTVETLTGRRPTGPIRLLTQLRCFGLVMNPVSFYYCLSATGDDVETLLADVTNTPWGERHVYTLSSQDATRTVWRASCSKEFHVSPFMPMEMEYRWRVTYPGNRLSVHIENYADAERVFDASLHLRRVELSAGAVVGQTLRHPFVTWQILAGIYWQALRLWRRGVPFHPHPRTTSENGKAA